MGKSNGAPDVVANEKGDTEPRLAYVDSERGKWGHRTLTRCQQKISVALCPLFPPTDDERGAGPPL